MSRFSDRKSKKVAGVAATFGEVFNIDPTFIRIGLVATFFLISWKLAVIAYVAAGIYLHIAKRDVLRRGGSADRPEDSYRAPRTSVHALRTQLDTNDRRMMAIDHHLNSAQNDELARSIEALRETDHA